MATTAKKRVIVKGIEHGLGGYTNYRCRCDTCREANRLHSARYRQRRFAGDPLCVISKCQYTQSHAYGNGLCYKHAQQAVSIRRQLNAMNRTKLKRVIVKHDLDIRVYRSTPTDEIRAAIIEALGLPQPTRPLPDE